MRAKHGLGVLATVASAAAIAAPAASAKFDNTTYPPLNAAQAVAHHAADPSSDGTILELAAAGAVLIAGAGLVGSRRRSLARVRPSASAGR